MFKLTESKLIVVPLRKYSHHTFLFRLIYSQNLKS